ncbi:wsv401 [White spot syndrome virus]|uniref:Wsv401 n=1 Tax=White spot syndrome virus TaxID=342409 RepID=K7WHW4_9VIRU|nr:wsv401 [White spot syndrome virus]
MMYFCHTISYGRQCSGTISCGGGYTSFHWWEMKYYGSILMEDGFLYPHANAMWKILYVSDKGKNMNKLSIHMSYPDI